MAKSETKLCPVNLSSDVPPVEASSDQDWHYVARYFGYKFFFSHLIFSYWRGKSYIAIQKS